MLDFATCTECGRCQSQCPAWNTGKPLSPKLLIMDLRDHLFAKAPYLLGARRRARPASTATAGGPATSRPGDRLRPRRGRRRRPGATARWSAPLEEGGVIDPDVLWSCTTCGACVEQCPVDIEHVDHIVDMRRYQVLIESAFPSEAGVMLQEPGEQGQPVGLRRDARAGVDQGASTSRCRSSARTSRTSARSSTCSGSAAPAPSRTAPRRRPRPFAELLHIAGVKFAVLGEGETCTGDPARRLGNEFVFQMLAQQNVETLNDGRRRQDA